MYNGLFLHCQCKAVANCHQADPHAFVTVQLALTLVLLFGGFTLLAAMRKGVITRFRVAPLSRVGLILGRELMYVVLIGFQAATSQLEKTHRVEEVRRFMPAERIFLNPDCGFGTFSSRPMNAPEVAYQKMKAMSEAARQLRARLVVSG